MNCNHGTCLQESLGQRLARISAQVLRELAGEIVRAATRRQHYLEIRTRAMHLALSQRVCCGNLLTRDTDEKAVTETRDA